MGSLELPPYVRAYLQRAIQEVGQGMKALVVDAETVSIVSAVMTQTEILQKEVYLVERLESPVPEQMMHLKALCFVRPTQDNVSLLRRQLRSPRYGEYHLFFSNVVRDSQLQELAEADDGELVRQVQEYYADYVAVDPTHFVLDVPDAATTMMPPLWHARGASKALDRAVEGLAAVLLTLKRKPSIRYQASSQPARRVAGDLQRLAYEQEAALFDFRRSEGTLLLVLDRLNDPVTPLLSQWTYQAMVHELLGVRNNRVDLSHLPKQPADQKEVVLSCEQDDFFRANMYENYGDLGANIKRMVDEFQDASASNRNIESIEDMQRFVESYPEFRAKQGNVSKHVALVGELSKLVGARKLMQVSQVEQDLACGSERSMGFEAVMELLDDMTLREEERVRLVMLFALRWEGDGDRQAAQLVDRLCQTGVRRELVELVRAVVKYGGEARRSGDLFGSRSLFAKASKMMGGLKGVDNVYTQHTPLLSSVLEQLGKGKLKEQDYPSLAGGATPPRDVVVFVLGGTTYEEARAVHLFNQGARKDGHGLRVLLGGTGVINSAAFLEALAEMGKAEGGGR
mmetsp:Transcript_16400/g.55827  ORF Transcript_16400/g.55827 Transcript_16400/m.55827 type:complete len:570 (+) Transcript_16400:155-1864(+)